MSNNPNHLCPGCDSEVTDKQKNSIQCDRPAPKKGESPAAKEPHWWHRLCLQKFHLLEGNQIPLPASLLDHVHGKNFAYQCHLCDNTGLPLSIRLFEQNFVTKNDLEVHGAFSKHVKQYFIDHKLDPSLVRDARRDGGPDGRPSLLLPSSSFSPGRVHSVPSSPTDTNFGDPPPVLKQDHFVSSAPPNQLHIQEIPLTHPATSPSDTTPSVTTTPSLSLATGGGGGTVSTPGVPGPVVSHGIGPSSQVAVVPQANSELAKPPDPNLQILQFMQTQIQSQQQMMMQFMQNMEKRQQDEERRREAERRREDELREQRRVEEEDRRRQRELAEEERQRQRRREDEQREQQRAAEAHAREEESKAQREFYERLTLRSASSSVPSPNTTAPVPTSHFPKSRLKPPTFAGDVLKWPSYWDGFLATVHNNPNFSSVQKLHALFESLEGPAKKAVENYKLEANNYDTVLEVLKGRFDDKIKIKNAHLQSLMTLSPATKCDATHLLNFLDTVNLHARGLLSLENNDEKLIDLQCATIVPCLFEKLPLVIRSQMFDNGGGEVRTHLSKFRASLQARVKVQESIQGSSWLNVSPQSHTPGDGSSASGHKSARHAGAGLLVPEPQPKRGPPQRGGPPSRDVYCHFCEVKNSHPSVECDKYTTLASRKQKLGRVCYVCLKGNHFANNCTLRSKLKCKTCKSEKHHSCLCPKSFPTPPSPPSKTDKNESGHLTLEQEASEGQLVSSDVDKVLCDGEQDVAMQTAVVSVKNPTNSLEATANVLLDSGCKRTYISRRLADLLQLPSLKKCWRHITTFNTTKVRKVQAAISELQFRGQDGSLISLIGNVITHIASSVYLEGFLLSKKDKSLVKPLKMADSKYSIDRNFEIDILLGNDFYAMLLCARKLQLEKSGVYLLETQLGWVTSGVIRDNARLTHSKEHSDSENLALFVDESKPVVLEEDYYSPIEDLWKFETLGIRDPKQTDINDHIALKQFKETVKFENGRVCVRWLTKKGIRNLPSNFTAALVRLKSLLRTLGKNIEHHDKYCQNFDNYLDQEIIEIVSWEDNKGFQIHYIPHHAVFKFDSKTTKMRIVFDASAPTSNGKSLNDYLYRGPNLLTDLGGLLLRFRTYLIALLSDIEKAFLQVELQESDRDLTRFLWLKDPSQLTVENNVQIYRFKRVPFGFKPSPFLLTGSVWILLDKAIESETPVAEKIRDNIYVDNVITGVSSVSEAKNFYPVAKNLFNRGSMNLREWSSNSAEVLESIPEKDRDDRPEIKVLGVKWDKNADTLSICMRPIADFLSATTKRDILACMASIYDPLGLVSCAKIQGMIFLQEVWRDETDWDEPVSTFLLQKWCTLCEIFKIIPEIRFPRLLCNIIPGTTVQLLCMCDASHEAFCTTIYIRAEQVNGSVDVGLGFCKARLCPVSGLSVPRSELMAVLIGTRCSTYVQNQLGVEVSHTYLWTDSQCVLGWINNEAMDQGVFVTNRIHEILNHENFTFNYIPSEHNLADLATKSRKPGFVIPWDLWTRGHDWFRLPISHWPKFECASLPAYPSPFLLAGGANPQNLRNEAQESCNLESIFVIENFSAFMHLVRVTAWVRRFVKCMKERVAAKKGTHTMTTRSKGQAQAKALKSVSHIAPLHKSELKSAQNLWLVYVQRKEYPDLFTKKIRRSSFAQNLRLQVGDDCLLRSYGRFGESNLTSEAKYPILLPPKSEITHLIVTSFHKQFLHSGVNYTLAQIRSHFWIPQGRKIVRSVVNKCVHCKKFHAKPFAHPKMPDLPKERVTQAPPFTYTGTDYLGPLYFKTSHGEQKAWVVLFTCFGVRAVHLEVVPDMTTENFLCAFRRFVSRRGRPITIFSDNAKQFKMCFNILKHVAVQNFLQSEGIRWKFIPELSPFQAGVYERLVGVTKDSLKKALGKSVLNFEQLRTVLTEVEDIVNSRPISFVNMSPNDDDLVILTPQKFLSTGRNERLPIFPDDDPADPEFLPSHNTKTGIIQKWKQAQYYLNLFWEVWHKNYLLSLRERHVSDKFPKVKSEVFRAPRVGEIVLVKSQNLPRGLWKLGRIVEVHPGRDSLVRSVKVKTTDSREPITRPVSLLFPLEIGDSDLDAAKQAKFDDDVGLLAVEPDTPIFFSDFGEKSESYENLSSHGQLQTRTSSSFPSGPCLIPCTIPCLPPKTESTVAPECPSESITPPQKERVSEYQFSYCFVCDYKISLILSLLILVFSFPLSHASMDPSHSHNLSRLNPCENMFLKVRMDEIDRSPRQDELEEFRREYQDLYGKKIGRGGGKKPPSVKVTVGSQGRNTIQPASSHVDSPAPEKTTKSNPKKVDKNLGKKTFPKKKAHGHPLPSGYGLTRGHSQPRGHMGGSGYGAPELKLPFGGKTPSLGMDGFYWVDGKRFWKCPRLNCDRFVPERSSKCLCEVREERHNYKMGIRGANRGSHHQTRGGARGAYGGFQKKKAEQEKKEEPGPSTSGGGEAEFSMNIGPDISISVKYKK